MTNYPPGVTGNEPAIAGARAEFEETREVGECSSVGMYVTTIRTIYGIKRGPGGDIFRRHKRVTAKMCTFGGGSVVGDLAWYGGGIVYFDWICPSCGTAHTDEIDVEEFAPDPDADR